MPPTGETTGPEQAGEASQSSGQRVASELEPAAAGSAAETTAEAPPVDMTDPGFAVKKEAQAVGPIQTGPTGSGERDRDDGGGDPKALATEATTAPAVNDGTKPVIHGAQEPFDNEKRLYRTTGAATVSPTVTPSPAAFEQQRQTAQGTQTDVLNRPEPAKDGPLARIKKRLGF